MKPELIEHPNGTKEWLLNGKRHREDGPAYVEICDYDPDAYCEDYFFHGVKAKSLEQLQDPVWRKKVILETKIA